MAVNHVQCYLMKVRRDFVRVARKREPAVTLEQIMSQRPSRYSEVFGLQIFWLMIWGTLMVRSVKFR